MQFDPVQVAVRPQRPNHRVGRLEPRPPRLRLRDAPHHAHVVDPDHADARRVVAQLDAALAAITGESGAASFDPQDCRGALACFVLAYDADGSAVGCGAVLRDPRGWGEVKRMYVRPDQRGRGLGRRVLADLEGVARGAGLPLLRLETGIHNTEALALYRRAGFVECSPFGDYAADPLSVFMEKRVDL